MHRDALEGEGFREGGGERLGGAGGWGKGKLLTWPLPKNNPGLSGLVMVMVMASVTPWQWQGRQGVHHPRCIVAGHPCTPHNTSNTLGQGDENQQRQDEVPKTDKGEQPQLLKAKKIQAPR